MEDSTAMTSEYRYLLLDVFTDTPLLGNQLAVFLDGDGLTDAQMQALAGELNLSETTFCFPKLGAAGEGVRARIFTTQEELPFAGHPTLGTAAALRWAIPELHGAAEVRLKLRVGEVPVRFAAGKPEQAPGLQFRVPVTGEMEQPLPMFGQVHAHEEVARALGLPLVALDREKPVQTVSTGIPFVVVPLVSVEALAELRVPQEAAEAYLRGSDGKFFYVIAPAGDRGTAWRARMQFYGGEDPATGSAAGCAIAYLVRHGYAPQEAPLLLEQGVEMRRRSVIRGSGLLRLSANAHAANEAQGDWEAGSYIRVGGSTVLVAEGRFFLQGCT
jgi:trans-2,3-dihydro-3-hydroxyanthranilate isomerase